MKPLSLEAVIHAVEGQRLGRPSTFIPTIHRVVTDSRQVKVGDLYIPIIGEHFDGHDFIDKAFEAGATAVLTDRELELVGDQEAIRVEDTRIALGKIAAYYRKQFDIPFIGITGSVGKTSTKEMLATILGVKYKVHKTLGNYNNDIGLPLTLLDLDESHEVAVIEMGMNHFGEIDYLAGLLKPNVGMITNIGVAHIEFLGSREGILKAKTEMLPHVQEGGLVVLNGDDDLLRTVRLKNKAKCLFYGSKDTYDCTMTSHRLTLNGGQRITVVSEKATYDVVVGYPGEHVLHNALGCILIAEHLGLRKEEIIAGIAAYRPADMRLNAIRLGNGAVLVDDAYNASVDSMNSALKTLMTMKETEGKAIAVLGSMFEMGAYAKEGHKEVGKMVSDYKPHLLFAVGKEALWIAEGAKDAGYPEACIRYYELQSEMLEALAAEVDGHGTILLKASRGMHLEIARDYLIERFEEKG